ncbi:hypothetical protein [Streptomyces katrae]|uniref:hypothetical protein n=1 Tax=Streptomyces katrae TaxID=68223 RepID=UPI0004C28248|nr:hypothetical protein [Streptomyces katrae]
MHRLVRVVTAAVVLSVCAVVTASCRSEGQDPAPGAFRAQPLGPEELRAAMPSGRQLPGYLVGQPEGRPGGQQNGAARATLTPDSPPACQKFVDFMWEDAEHRPTADLRAAVRPAGDPSGRLDLKRLHSLRLASYTVDEATAVMEGLKRALPLCKEFVAYTLMFGDQDVRVVVKPGPAAGAGDDSVVFTWTTPGLPLNEPSRTTVVRTRGVLATYHGAVPASVPRGQHEKLLAASAAG